MQQTDYPRRTGWKESALWECRLCSSRCHDCRTAGRKVPYHWLMHSQCSTKSYGRFGKKFRNGQNPCRLSVRAKHSPLSAASDPLVQLPRYRRCRNRAAVLCCYRPSIRLLQEAIEKVRLFFYVKSLPFALYRSTISEMFLSRRQKISCKQFFLRQRKCADEKASLLQRTKKINLTHFRPACRAFLLHF